MVLFVCLGFVWFWGLFGFEVCWFLFCLGLVSVLFCCWVSLFVRLLVFKKITNCKLGVPSLLIAVTDVTPAKSSKEDD